jgi:hypothetical protein
LFNKQALNIVDSYILGIHLFIGWVINFVTERIFKRFFQTNLRDQFFKNATVNYYEIRGLFFQKASKDAIEDLRFDRHILRIARSSTINFLLIGLVLFFHIKKHTNIIILLIIFSYLMAFLSFLQWRARYKSMYSKMLDTYNVIEK